MADTNQIARPNVTYDDKVSAVLNVSNTDIVTMMMVKNRKHLNEKLINVAKEYAVKLDQQATILHKKVLDAYNKNKKAKDMITALTTVVSLMNPKKQVFVQVNGLTLDSVRNVLAGNYGYRGYGGRVSPQADSKGNRVVLFILDSPEVRFYDKDPDIDQNAEELDAPWQDDIFVELNLKVSIPYDPTMETLSNEINRIKDIMQNENKLRDEVVANITEQALEQSDLLKNITSNLKLID